LLSLSQRWLLKHFFKIGEVVLVLRLGVDYGGAMLAERRDILMLVKL
jgi:hypothetical protein